MKKLLPTLLCLPLIFSSCQEDDPAPSATPSSSSSLCGNAIVTINNGTTLSSYIPTTSTSGCLDAGSVAFNTNAEPYLLGAALTSWPNTLSWPEWSISFDLHNYGSGIINYNISYDHNPSINRNVQFNFSSYDSAGMVEVYANFDINAPSPNGIPIRNGTIRITNIDLINNLISGEIEFTGYIQGSPATNQTKDIHCSFSDIPVEFN